jgi:hypothetical protein
VGTEFTQLRENTSFKKYFSFANTGSVFTTVPIMSGSTLAFPSTFSFGLGFAVETEESYYETQTSMLNTSFEFGSRGDKNTNLRENTFRVGIALP